MSKPPNDSIANSERKKLRQRYKDIVADAPKPFPDDGLTPAQFRFLKRHPETFASLQMVMQQGLSDPLFVMTTFIGAVREGLVVFGDEATKACCERIAQCFREYLDSGKDTVQEPPVEAVLKNRKHAFAKTLRRERDEDLLSEVLFIRCLGLGVT